MNIVPPPIAQKKQEGSSKYWLVLVPVIIFIIVLFGFALSLLMKKKPGKRLSQPDKNLDKLNYVKPVPTTVVDVDEDGLSDLTEEEREYILGVLQKTNVVHSNY
jgi:hypothetical protein